LPFVTTAAEFGDTMTSCVHPAKAIAKTAATAIPFARISISPS
jgi:hypothetical protein